METSLVVHQKVKCGVNHMAQQFHQRWTPTRTENMSSGSLNRNAYSSMSHSSQREETKRPSANEWMNRPQYIHAVEYYAAMDIL